MTDDEAIAILEKQFVSDSGFLVQLSRGERPDQAGFELACQALDDLKEAWRNRILVPKRAVWPMMYVDRFLSSDEPARCTDDEIYAVFDMSSRLENSLITSYGDADASLLHSLAIGTEHHRAYLPNLGLTDEPLSAAYDVSLGEDGVLFDGRLVRYLEEWRVRYALETFESLVRIHSADEMIPGALEGLLVGLYGHIVRWRRPEPDHKQKQLDLADQLWTLSMRYLGAQWKRPDRTNQSSL